MNMYQCIYPSKMHLAHQHCQGRGMAGYNTVKEYMRSHMHIKYIFLDRAYVAS